ncbi:MAG TPA: hypothetical protein VK864_09190 [Longimicrobiales bacterium]|nr:hypothetical protein [Longimicrobiales bacterium]
MTRITSILCLLALAGLAACEGNGRPAPAAATPARSAGTELIAGTPAGDLEDWVRDLSAGLDTVAASLADRSNAHSRVLALYVGRQEYLEMYYGPGGRMSPPPDVAEAIKQAEARFHELMKLTGATPPADEKAVRDAIGGVRQQLERVLSLSSKVEQRVRPGSR